MQMNKKIKKTTRVVDVPKNNEWPVTIRFNHARLLFRWINLFSTFIALLFNTGLEWMKTKFCGFASMNFIVYFTHSQTQKKRYKKRRLKWLDHNHGLIYWNDENQGPGTSIKNFKMSSKQLIQETIFLFWSSEILI